MMSVGVRELEIALSAFELCLAGLREARAKAAEADREEIDRRIAYWEGRKRAAQTALDRVREISKAEKAIVRGDLPQEG